MIPKIIHYCWFGGGKIPDQYAENIEQWKQMHPDWVIKRWDELTTPMSMPYIQKAFELNNWANVSNYVRIYALRTEGGIYLDTDMKLVKPLDTLLIYNCFLGFESGENDIADSWLNNAIMGAIPSHPFVVACEDRLLNQFDGSEKSNLSSPHLVTNALKEQYGLGKYGRQMLQDIMIFEKEVFYPIPYNKTYLLKQDLKFPEETIAVHMWGRTWFDHAMMLDIIDDLQRHTDEGQKIINNITKELDRVQNENNYLRDTLATFKNLDNNIKLLYVQQQSFEQSLAALQLELSDKIIEQQKNFEQQLIKLNLDLENNNQNHQEIINHYKKAYEESSIWQIAKRRFLKK